MNYKALYLALSFFFLASCGLDNDGPMDSSGGQVIADDNNIDPVEEIRFLLNGKIDLENLSNYADQSIPQYIQKDNTGTNSISNIEATLGRVLFYDKNLSSDNTISCASCHKQEYAFGDDAQQSQGVNGLSGRHSMRLVNARFATEQRFFWDERANALEAQTTMPIQDHIEMGFSGMDGDENIEDLLIRLNNLEYYKELTQRAFGKEKLTEERMQIALAQFVRSIQSFDSKYDEGRNMVNNDNQDFPNYSAEENMGKRLFLTPPQFSGPSGERIGGGLGCSGCHNAPEFDIKPNSGNNGVINVAGQPGERDYTVTRSPSLRDLFNNTGALNGPLMHSGTFSNLNEVLDHYNNINRMNGNNNLDPVLARGGGVRLNMTDQERNAVIAFIKTLSGNSVYTEEKWSDVFN